MVGMETKVRLSVLADEGLGRSVVLLGVGDWVLCDLKNDCFYFRLGA